MITIICSACGREIKDRAVTAQVTLCSDYPYDHPRGTEVKLHVQCISEFFPNLWPHDRTYNTTLLPSLFSPGGSARALITEDSLAAHNRKVDAIKKADSGG